MADSIKSMKDKLKANIGKIKNRSKEKASETKNDLAKKYDSGVGKVQSTALADKMADMSDGLTKKNEKELLENKDSTFRKVRKVFINGTVLITPFIIGIPIKMVDDAIQRNVDLKNAEEYDKIFERELLWVDSEIAKRRKEGKEVKDLVKYRESIKNAKAKNDAYIKKIQKDKEKQDESTKATKEALDVRNNFDSLTPFQKFTYIKPDHFESMEAFDNALVESFTDLLYDAATHIQYPKVNPVEETTTVQPEPEKEINTEGRKSAFIATEGFFINSVIGDKALQGSIRTSCTSGGKACFTNGTYDKVNIFTFDYEKKFGKKVTESIIRPINQRLAALVETLNRKISSTGCEMVIEGTTFEPQIILKEESITKHAENAVRKGVHVARDVAPNESPIKKAERATEPLDNAINSIIGKFRDAMKSDTKEKIVGGSEYRFKAVRIIAKCIAYGGLAVLVHPAVAAIAFLGKMAFDKHIDVKERAKIVNDLQTELEVTKEKIKDADSKGDNENKYKLMRIEKSLENEINRIKLHQDK